MIQEAYFGSMQRLSIIANDVSKLVRYYLSCRLVLMWIRYVLQGKQLLEITSNIMYGLPI